MIHTSEVLAPWLRVTSRSLFLPGILAVAVCSDWCEQHFATCSQAAVVTTIRLGFQVSAVGTAETHAWKVFIYANKGIRRERDDYSMAKITERFVPDIISSTRCQLLSTLRQQLLSSPAPEPSLPRWPSPGRGRTLQVFKSSAGWEEEAAGRSVGCGT